MPSTVTSPGATDAGGSLTPGARIHNFSAGPAVLPESVLRDAQRDIWNVFESGIGILEHSHRGKVFEGIIEEAEADCRRVGSIGADHAVLFLQGGASLQFGMIPMSFLPEDTAADYADTGGWARKAIEEARRIGPVNVAFDGSASEYGHTPADGEMSLTPGAAYLHYCSNNTLYGTRYPAPPATDAPLVADMSSEMFSRPVDVDRHALIYAGAQKNLGPAGVTLVIIRKDFMEAGRTGLTSMLDYRAHAAKGSRLNTPPTFGIYVMGRVFKWILDQGGIGPLAKANDEKARIVYDAIDHSGDFYRGVARPDCRSVMNVCFRTPSPDLDGLFVEEALAAGMSGLKGHRSVGGLRASIYNAFPRAGCTALAEFMNDFRDRHG